MGRLLAAFSTTLDNENINIDCYIMNEDEIIKSFG